MKLSRIIGWSGIGTTSTALDTAPSASSYSSNNDKPLYVRGPTITPKPFLRGLSANQEKNSHVDPWSHPLLVGNGERL